jgi:hypothetical protein
VRDFEIVSVDRTFRGQSLEEYLNEIKIPKKIASGLLAATSVPIGGLTGGNLPASIGGALLDGIQMAATGVAGIPGEFSAIGDLNSIQRRLVLDRADIMMIHNTEIRVTITREVYVERRFWLNGWRRETQTHFHYPGHRGQPSASDFQNVVSGAKKRYGGG